MYQRISYFNAILEILIVSNINILKKEHGHPRTSILARRVSYLIKFFLIKYYHSFKCVSAQFSFIGIKRKLNWNWLFEYFQKILFSILLDNSTQLNWRYFQKNHTLFNSKLTDWLILMSYYAKTRVLKPNFPAPY